MKAGLPQDGPPQDRPAPGTAQFIFAGPLSIRTWRREPSFKQRAETSKRSSLLASRQWGFFGSLGGPVGVQRGQGAFWEGLEQFQRSSWGILGVGPGTHGKTRVRSTMLRGGGLRRVEPPLGTHGKTLACSKRRALFNCTWRIGSEDLSRTLLVASS